MSEDNGSENVKSSEADSNEEVSPTMAASASSKAIPIVAPSPSAPLTDDKEQDKGASPSQDNGTKPITNTTIAGKSAKLCKNVIIHGFCKYEGKGCEFYHPPSEDTAGSSETGSTTAPSATGSQPKTKLSVGSKSFKPGGSGGNSKTLQDIAKKAPVFVPKQASTPTVASAPSFTPSNTSYGDSSSGNTSSEYMNYSSEVVDASDLSSHFAQLDVDHSQGYSQGHNYNTSYGSGSEYNAMLNTPRQTKPALDPYAYQSSQEMASSMPLQYHLYQLPLAHVNNLLPHQRTLHQFFMSDSLREDLQRRSEASHAISNDPHLPDAVHVYHSLSPLEVAKDKSSRIFGYPTTVYKSTCSVDGLLYCLRRVEGFRLTNELAIHTIEKWRRVQHGGVVSVREAFTTKAFGDNSIVFAYDYHPLAMTLYDAYFSPEAHLGQQYKELDEQVIWSYIVQLSSALRAIHAAGLAARIVEPSKLLVTSKNRIRLNACGIFDVIAYDGGHNTASFQQEDLINFGKMVVSLACKSIASVHNLAKSIDFVARNYSPDLKNVALFLLSKPTPLKTIDEVIKMLGTRIIDEVDNCHHYDDFLENELGRELENSRLVRLVVKLGFINERPEFDHDPSWSETGDRYIIKLFRDYVFHQVDERGMPVVDFAHVIMCLNKLDAGVEEKIMLVSRDEQSCLIVTYKEIKNCIDQAYRDLTRVLR